MSYAPAISPNYESLPIKKSQDLIIFTFSIGYPNNISSIGEKMFEFIISLIKLSSLVTPNKKNLHSKSSYRALIRY
jgi:hypothetical protein|tara:strand:+ start:166 stop:393 length:228 start_codon:yes stop_codon:yes gene_type:complete